MRIPLIVGLMGLIACEKVSETVASPIRGCQVQSRTASAVTARCGAMQLSIVELASPANDDTFAEHLALYEHQFTGGTTRRSQMTVADKTFEVLVRESADGRWRGELRVGPGSRGTRLVSCGGPVGPDSSRCETLLQGATHEGMDALARRTTATDAGVP